MQNIKCLMLAFYDLNKMYMAIHLLNYTVYKHQFINIYKDSTGMTIHSKSHCEIHSVRNGSCRIEGNCICNGSALI